MPEYTVIINLSCMALILWITTDIGKEISGTNGNIKHFISFMALIAMQLWSVAIRPTAKDKKIK